MRNNPECESERWIDEKRLMAHFGCLPNGRKGFCGVWTIQGTRKDGPTHMVPRARGGAIAPRRKFVRLRCKCWSCSLCGPRKATRYRAQILRAMSRHKLHRFLTLTLDVHKFASQEELTTYEEHFKAHKSMGKACRCATCLELQKRSIAHIRKCWNKLRYYMLRRFKVAPTFIAVLEFQKETGMAHLHIVVDRYIEQSWIKESWQTLGGGQHVDIRHVDVHRAAAYLSKYLSKDMLLSAPSGMRRVSTSRSVRLDQKKASEYQWKVLDLSIDSFFSHLGFYSGLVQDIVRSDGELESFSVQE